jgi:hypothetical protein
MKLKSYHLCLVYIFLFASCTVYNVVVIKNIHIDGDDNKPVMTGSELDEIKASPENKPDIAIDNPILP